MGFTGLKNQAAGWVALLGVLEEKVLPALSGFDKSPRFLSCVPFLVSFPPLLCHHISFSDSDLPASLLGRSLWLRCSSWGRKELDTTEQLN